MEDYYKQHPEEADKISFKIYSNDGVINEMTELEACKIRTKRMQRSDGGEQAMDKYKKKIKG